MHANGSKLGPWKTYGVWTAIGLLLAACSGGAPWAADAPDTWCNTEMSVYAPPPQGPEGTQEESRTALDCIVEAFEEGEEKGLEFTYLETEGASSQAMIHSRADGTVDFYLDRGLGWDVWLGCESFAVLDPGTIEVANCDRTPGVP